MTTFTNDILQAHVKSGKISQGFFGESRSPARMLVCADGFEVSAQASETHYCSPRNNAGPYTTVELGFPSKAEPTLMPYCEDPERPTGTVYAQVPVDIVVDLINKHGGLKAKVEQDPIANSN